MSSDQPPIRRRDAWRHQLAAYHYAKDRPATMLALGMGTGKTKVALDLVQNSDARTVLVLCPVSVLEVWRDQFAQHMERMFAEIKILDRGTAGWKAAEASHFLAKESVGPRLLVISYDSARMPAFASWALKQSWDWVILDESHRIKQASGKTSRFCARLADKARRRLCLTGTPMPHSPLDIFAQYRFLDRRIFGYYYTQFRSRYAVTDRMFPSKVLRWINQDELSQKVARIAYRVGSDVLDLPPLLKVNLPVALSSSAMRTYRELRDELVTEMRASDGTVTVTVDNALVKLLRLQQIASGNVSIGGDSVHMIDSGKTIALEEFLLDLDRTEKVVVFCRFVSDLSAVRRVAESLGRNYGELSGRHNDLIGGRLPSEAQVFAVQIQAGGLGVDLSAASYCVYYTLGYSLGDYEQSLARLHRPGQKKSVRAYHLIATGTVDEDVIRALDHKREVVDFVLRKLKGEYEHIRQDAVRA